MILYYNQSRYSLQLQRITIETLSRNKIELRSKPKNRRKLREKDMKFITSDGRTINFLGGYFERFKTYPFNIKDFKTYADTIFNDRRSEQNLKPSLNPTILFKKLAQANSIEQLIDDLGLQIPADASLLDLCTGTAIIPRALKARSVVKRADGVDLKLQMMDYPQTQVEELWPIDSKTFAPGSWKTLLDIYQNVSNKIIGRNHSFNYLFEPWIPEQFTLDNAWQANLNHFEPQSQYDLITLISAINFFDIAQCFKKISTCLKPGGYLITSNTYFYDIDAGAMKLPMDVPWLHAMMNKDDMMRYYQEHHPQYAEAAEHAYYFFDTHRVTEDYLRIAQEYSFEAIYSKYSPNIEIFTRFASGLRLLIQHILPHAQILNPATTQRDLFASHFTIVLRKSEFK